MLVASVRLSSPPFTSTRPSASMAVPGQNMLWVVLVTVSTTALAGAAGSISSVTVWSSAPVPPKRSPFHEAQASTLPLRSRAAEMGTTLWVEMTALQRPLASDCATEATVFSVHRNLVAVLHVFCTSALVLALPGDCTHLP